MIQVLRECFPQFNEWLDRLPDPRRQDMCRYSGAHLRWNILGTCLFRAGSRNAFDEKRNTGQAPWNFAVLCGQASDDPRFASEPTVTCSDNAARHARRVAPEAVQAILLKMVRRLLKRRLFDGSRLFGRCM